MEEKENPGEILNEYLILQNDVCTRLDNGEAESNENISIQSCIIVEDAQLYNIIVNQWKMDSSIYQRLVGKYK